jgi:hypothetical protein
MGIKVLATVEVRLSLMAKRILLIGSASWTKSAIFFSNIGNMSHLIKFLEKR